MITFTKFNTSLYTPARRLGAFLVGAVTVALGVKTLATPATAAAQLSGAVLASGGSTIVTGSNNVTASGKGAQVVSGPQNGLINGIDNQLTVIIQQRALSGAQGATKPAAETPFGSTASLAKRLYGVWDDHYSVPGKGGAMEVEGAMTFLRNGAYNFRGTETARYVVDGKSMVIAWDVIDAGRWTARDGYVTVERGDLRTQIRTLIVDGQTKDVARLKAMAGRQGEGLFKIEAYEPNGVSTDYKLLALTATQIRLQGHGVDGTVFDFVAARHPEAG